MTGISSFLPSAATATSQLASTKRTPTAYEINAAEFGPGVATAIGVAATAVDAATSTVSLSADGLKSLASDAGAAVDAVEGALSDLGDGVVSIGHRVADDLKRAYGAVGNSVSSAVSAIESGVESAENAASSMASTIGKAASDFSDEVVSLTDGATRYLAAGLSVLT